MYIQWDKNNTVVMVQLTDSSELPCMVIQKSGNDRVVLIICSISFCWESFSAAQYPYCKG